MSQTLEAAFEAALMADLQMINSHGLTGEGKNDQGPLWPPKERVNLYKIIAEHCASKRKLDASGGLGGALGGGRRDE